MANVSQSKTQPKISLLQRVLRRRLDAQIEAGKDDKRLAQTKIGERPGFGAVLFDLDGTLLDTTEAILCSLQYTVNHLTGKTPEKEDLRKYLGWPLTETFSELLPQKMEEACEVYLQHNLSIHKTLVRPFPNVKKTIARLQECRIKLAVVTSKRRCAVMEGLNLAGLTEAFDVLVCYGETERPKPYPDPVLKAVELLGLEKGRVLMVGDTPSDIRSAKNAQALLSPATIMISTAAATYGTSCREILVKEEPDYLIDDISEVLGLCGCNP